MMVNFMCQPDWAKDAQVADKTLLLGVSLKVFLKKISI